MDTNICFRKRFYMLLIKLVAQKNNRLAFLYDTFSNTQLTCYSFPYISESPWITAVTIIALYGIGCNSSSRNTLHSALRICSITWQATQRRSFGSDVVSQRASVSLNGNFQQLCAVHTVYAHIYWLPSSAGNQTRNERFLYDVQTNIKKIIPRQPNPVAIRSSWRVDRVPMS